MISSIDGTVLSTDSGLLEISLKDTGISFVVSVPLIEKFSEGSKAKLYTYLHWNQDNGPSMFGFEDKMQRSLFTTVISCSGIGPKMGLAIIEQLGVGGFVSAVQQQDIKAMSSVSGIGAKKAEQIIVQLRHKIDKLVEKKEFVSAGGFGYASQIREVLNSLNYSGSEITQAIDFAKHNSGSEDETFDVALRRALSFLSKNV